MFLTGRWFSSKQWSRDPGFFYLVPLPSSTFVFQNLLSCLHQDVKGGRAWRIGKGAFCGPELEVTHKLPRTNGQNTKTRLCVTAGQAGKWCLVAPEKKIRVGNQPVGQQAQLKSRVLLSRKKRGWTWRDRSQFLSQGASCPEGLASKYHIPAMGQLQNPGMASFYHRCHFEMMPRHKHLKFSAPQNVPKITTL